MRFVPQLVTIPILILGCTYASKHSSLGQVQEQIIVEHQDTSHMAKARFDIKTYEKRKADQSTEFEESDGTLVQQFEVGSGSALNYMEYRTPPPPALYKTFWRFYGDGSLKLEGQKFYSGMNYGVWKTYDETGRLMEEKDYNAPYSMTVEEFLTLVDAYHKKHEIPKVDIRDKRTSINREEDKPDNFWTFSWEATPGRVELLKFSDSTKELLNVSHYNLSDN